MLPLCPEEKHPDVFLSRFRVSHSVRSILNELWQLADSFADAILQRHFPQGLPATNDRAVAGIHPYHIPWRDCQWAAKVLHDVLHFGESKCPEDCRLHEVCILLEHKVLPADKEQSAKQYAYLEMTQAAHADWFCRRQLAITQEGSVRFRQADAYVSCDCRPRRPQKSVVASIRAGRARADVQKAKAFVCCEAMEAMEQGVTLSLEVRFEDKTMQHAYVEHMPSRAGEALGTSFAAFQETAMSATARQNLAIVMASSSLQLGHTPWLARFWHLSDIRFRHVPADQATRFDDPFVGCPNPVAKSSWAV